MGKKALLAAFLCVALALPLVARAALQVKPGSAMPDLLLDAPVDPSDYAALGLTKTAGSFRLSEIPGSVLVLHFFNHHCPHCERQAPLLDSFYRSVVSGDLAGKVRLLAVGAGSSPRDLKDFRTAQKVSYPMVPDIIFDAYEAMGDPGGTPLSLFLRKSGNRWMLSDFHFGMQGDSELVAQARVLLEGKTGDPKVFAAKAPPARTAHLVLSEKEQLSRAKRFLAKIAGKPVEVDAVAVGKGKKVFRVLGADRKPSGLYARVASRDPVCDLCHTILFLFAFDDSGVVRGFEPIHVTKYGNEVWSAADAARLEGRLKGRRMKGLSFDAAVDAVTSGTISSQLIFDEARRTAPLLEGLRSR